ncbi:MAG: Rrf2 family transcriptional regulator [Bacteroidia bacterium]|nr:Rrf2 family transcriptional regulator [Bacteroidia bacterium]
MFSKTCKYGIKALIYIATQSVEGKRVTIGEISKKTDTPEAFTAKILGTLSKNGLVSSFTGPNGGFEISDSKMKSVKMRDIVSVIDGNEIFWQCALGLTGCDDKNPCPVHNQFTEVRSKLVVMLESATVYDMATELRANMDILLR